MVFGGISNTHTYDWIKSQNIAREHMKKVKLEQENIFKEFEGRTIYRLETEESIVGKIREAEIELFGKRILENISGKEITGVRFGCGCKDSDYRLAGNYDNETRLYTISSKNYDTYAGENKSLVTLQETPEVVILNMFANKSKFGCDMQVNYPNMYVDFIRRDNMVKYPEL